MVDNWFIVHQGKCIYTVTTLLPHLHSWWRFATCLSTKCMLSSMFFLHVRFPLYLLRIRCFFCCLWAGGNSLFGKIRRHTVLCLWLGCHQAPRCHNIPVCAVVITTGYKSALRIACKPHKLGYVITWYNLCNELPSKKGILGKIVVNSG